MEFPVIFDLPQSQFITLIFSDDFVFGANFLVHHFLLRKRSLESSVGKHRNRTKFLAGRSSPERHGDAVWGNGQYFRKICQKSAFQQKLTTPWQWNQLNSFSRMLDSCPKVLKSRPQSSWVKSAPLLSILPNNGSSLSPHMVLLLFSNWVSRPLFSLPLTSVMS